MRIVKRIVDYIYNIKEVIISLRILLRYKADLLLIKKPLVDASSVGISSDLTHVMPNWMSLVSLSKHGKIYLQ